MQVEFGVRIGTGEVVDVSVRAPRGTTLAEVAAGLATCGAPLPQAPQVDGVDVDGSAVLGRPPLLQGVVLGPAGPGAAAPAPGAVTARVVAGPDAGRVQVLLPGRHAVGRGPGGAPPPGVALALADDRCSRVHAVLDVAEAGTVRVRDAGSLNGTALLGPGGTTPVTTALDVPAGHRVRVGGSVLDVHPPVLDPADLHPDGAGHLLLNRAPRLPADPAPVHWRWPGTPRPTVPGTGFPWLALLVPLAVAGVLAVLWSPFSLLLGLASPVLVGGQWWSGRRRHAAEHAAALRERDETRAGVRAGHAAALAAERERRGRAGPGPGDLAAHVDGRSTRLFERHPGDPDHLHLRVGLGPVRATSSEVRAEETVASEQAPPSPTLQDVPVLLDLTAGVVGVAGPREPLLRTARALLAQVAAWHSPDEVRISVLAPAAPADWAWTRWLPHTAALSLDDLAAELARRRPPAPGPAGPAGRDHPAHVVLVDGSAVLRRDPRLVEVLRDGPARGVHALCLDTDPRRLPAECAAVVELSPGAGAIVRTAGAPPTAVVPDGVPASWALTVARALAPLRDATPAAAGAVPVTCRLLDVLGLRPAGARTPDAAEVAARWSRGTVGLPVTLGVGVAGPVVLDLVGDGPHTLVAGTTGAGKSVLLSTLVVGLALTVPPDALQFVLVDYKGGAAFGGCTDLPHVAGLVTDLDEHLAGRVLRSLRAEVRRREEELREAGVADVRDLVAGSAAAARCPRLVVVVDEFRVLAADLPEFVEGLVRLAAVGRSLGVHLVLATQRPAGVVSPEIRANTNARIALRLHDRTDSEDVVGDPAAATLDDRLPGRALLRRGTRGLTTFQTASLRGPAGAAGVRVRRREVTPAPGPEEVDDLPGVLTAVRAAAVLRGRPVPPAPWLPTLPDRVAAADLPGAGPDVVPFGLLDLPDRQARAVAGWDLRSGGHLLVVGTVRSGRSTVLRTIARAAPAADVEITVLDGGGTLGDLSGLAQVASVVGPEETWRAGRVLRRLQEEVDRRRADFARRGVRDLAGRRALAGAEPVPHLLLLVDGWEGWSNALAEADPGAGPDVVHRLLREGSAAGVRIVVTGDRSLATGPVAGATAEVLLLRLANRADAALLGVPSRDVPRRSPAGRGLLLRGGVAHEVQVATGAPSPDLPAARPARSGVRPLPARVGVADLPGARGRWVPWGLGGDDATAVGVELSGPVLVHGPAGSGRTSALRVLAARAPGPLVVVGAGLVPAGRDDVTVAAAGSPAELDARLRGAPSTTVLVDDVGRPLDPQLEEVLTRFALGGGALVGAGDGAEVAAAFRGLPAVLRTARTLLLLGRGGRVGAEVLGRRPGPAPGEGPGAAFLVHDGAPAADWTALRVADPSVAAPDADDLGPQV